MTKKKTKHISKPKPTTISQQDTTQAQPVLEQYHQIAINLRISFSREQAGEALTEMNTMPENAQVAVVKALAKEAHVDAADVLTAVYELSPIKSVRKEARRSLIRLEEARIYPQWNVPIEQTSPYRIVAPSLPDQFTPDMPDVDEEPEEE